ncbi:hypothetical protein STTU_2342 [Streptomyces sp. Tu6071]|nr:hypothetical protein STTU_2342 [Streptomyces sp. Tu6071]
MHIEPHLLGTGSFRYGHSAQVRGQIVGASAQDTDQDLYESACLASDFVDALRNRHSEWERQHSTGIWTSADDDHAPEYEAMIDWFEPS